MSELDRIDPSLHAAYRVCRALNEQHGKTYFLATRLLPAHKRAGVHALYGFARMVDDIVDVDSGDLDSERDLADGESESSPQKQSDRIASIKLDAFERRIKDALAGATLGERPSDLVLSALVDTTARYDIAHDYFYAFLHSMRMDIPGTTVFRSKYRTMAELSEYMYGSAAVIGLQMLPILGTQTPRDIAAPPAIALGEAFQLTNFIRDMGEDLDRGRIYLPTDELRAFGVDEDVLRHCRTTGNSDIRLERAVAHLIALTRAVYRTAEPGIELLDPVVRPAMRTAVVLYSEILREIEDNGYRVLHRRERVPQRRRLAVAAPRLAETAVLTLRSRFKPRNDGRISQ